VAVSLVSSKGRKDIIASAVENLVGNELAALIYLKFDKVRITGVSTCGLVGLPIRSRDAAGLRIQVVQMGRRSHKNIATVRRRLPY
jgi:hypothetical protein